MQHFTKSTLRKYLQQSILFAILLSSEYTIAQQFRQLRDINNSTDSRPSNIYNASDGRSVSAFAVLNNIAYFSATGEGITQLWRSDGTTGGTYVFQNTAVSSITTCGNKIYYVADSAGYKVLTVSDGTATGTTVVKKFDGSEDPSSFTDIQGTLYFRIYSYAGQSELWKSEGTRESTSLIRVFSGYQNHLSGIANVNGSAFFINDVFFSDSLSGVWKSDGTYAGTTRISNASFGIGVNPYAYNGKYYYAVSSGLDALNVTNGTAPGTIKLAEINFPHNFISLNGVTYFSAADNNGHGQELWRTDGTVAGTYMLKDLLPGPDDSSPQQLTVVGNNIYFHAKAANGNRDLWKIDGTTQNISLVKDFGAGTLIAPAAFAAVNNSLYFTAYSAANGAELWKSDGTDVGTVIVKDIYPGEQSSYPGYITALNNKCIFSADDGLHGNEVWQSDGAAASTAMLKDINTVNTSSSSADRIYLSKLKNRIFFTATSPAHDVMQKSTSLWMSDGTSLNTKNLTGVGTTAKTSVISSQHFSTENRIYFTALDNHYNMQLWYADSSNTNFITNIAMESGAYFVGDDYFLNGADLPGPFYSKDSITYYFTLGNLWKIDERTNISSLVSQQRRGSFFQTNSQSLVASDTNLYRIVGGGITKIQTAKLSLDPAGRNNQIATAGKNAFFLSNQNLWKTDGTEPGTTLLNTITPVLIQYDNKFFSSIADTMFFAGKDGTTGLALWRTDGTPTGTRLVKDINAGSADGIAGQFCTVNNRIFFLGDDGQHGTELWTSDGTEQGTVMVKDISPGLAGSSISSLTKLGNKLAFLMYDYTSAKYFLWQSDGTDAGTFAVDDAILKNVIIAKSGGNFPSLYEYNNELYLIGSTTEYGSEIWAGTFGCKNSWTGAFNNAWENPANWSCGNVPDANSDVIINSGTIIVSSNVVIRSLSLKQGVSFTVSPGYHFTVLH